MADILSRGLRGSSILDRGLVEQPVGVDPAGGMSQLERGLRSSLAAQGASAFATEGLKAEIAGDAALAADRYALANEQRAKAEALSPRVRSIRDVGSFDDAMDYLAGGLPQVATSTLPAIAGAVVGRGIGGRLGAVAGGLAPAYNMEADETIGELAQDPTARARMSAEDILNTGRAKGAINAVLEVAGPAYLIERAIGGAARREGLRGALKTIGMGGLTEGGTEVVQETVGQGAKSFARTGDPAQEIDPWALADAGILGAAGGHAMATPAAGVGLAAGAVEKSLEAGGRGARAVADATKTGAGMALDAADPVLQAVRNKAGSAYDASKVDFLSAQTEDIPDEILNDPQAVMDHIAANDGKRKQMVSEHLAAVANDEAQPAERRAQAAELLQGIDDPATYERAAQLVVGMEKGKQYASRVKDFLDDAADFGKDFLSGKKQNAQAAGGATNQLMLRDLDAAMPQEAKDVGASDMLPHFANLFSGKVPGQVMPRLMREFIGVYGDSALDVASRMAEYAARDGGLDQQKTARIMQQLLGDADYRMEARHRAVTDNLTNEARLSMESELGRPLSQSDIGVISDLMTRVADGTMNKKLAEQAVPQLKKYLGDRYQHTMNIFRALHDADARNVDPISRIGELDDGTSIAGNAGESDMDFGERKDVASHETMMEGKGREFSLAKKGDIAPLFESREDAQKRWEEKIKPAHTNLKGTVIRGDEYAVLSGTDPIALAAQYDEKFNGEASDYRQRADMLKAAMELLRTKYAIQKDYVTNEDTDNLNEKELAGVFAKSKLPVREVEKPFKNDGRHVHIESEGKHYARDTKPTAADGYIFAHTVDKVDSEGKVVEGKARPIKMSALLYAMKGKQQRDELGGPDEGAAGKLNAVLAGLARLGDSGQLDLDKGLFMYNADGSQRWIVKPGGGSQKGLSTLEIDRQTLGELKQAVDRGVVARRKNERDKVAERLIEQYAGEDENYVPTAEEIDSAIKNKDWSRAAEKDGRTDTDSNIDKDEQEVAQRKDENESIFKDVQRRTREQSVKSGTAASSGELDMRIAALSAAIKASKLPAVAKNVAVKDLRTAMWHNGEGRYEQAVKTYGRVASRYQHLLNPEPPKGGGKNEITPAKKSEQETGKRSSPQKIVAAKEYLHKTLGKRIQVQFKKDLGGISGEWEPGDTENVIRIAMNAGPGVLSVAHHESIHELMSRLVKSGEKEVSDLLLRVANSEHVRRQLSMLLNNEVAALNAIKNDPEEALAYAYQFWAVGKLTLGLGGRNLFQKIKDFIRKVSGMLSEDQRAEELLTAFYDGKMAEPSAAGKVIAEIMSRGENTIEIGKKLKPLYDKAFAFVMPSYDVLADSDNPYAQQIAKTMYTPVVGENDGQWGFLNATRVKTAEWDDRFASAIGDLNKDELEMLRRVLSAGETTTHKPVAVAAKALRTQLDEFHKYLQSRGMKIGFREGYFPRVWNFEAIAENKDAFTDMLLKHYTPVLERMAATNNEALTETQRKDDKLVDTAERVAARIANRMTMFSGVEQGYGDVREEATSAGYTPYMQAANEMKLDFIDDKFAQEFLEQDLVKIMTSYFKQGVRRAEYESRAGKDGKKLADLLNKAFDHEFERVIDEKGYRGEYDAVKKRKDGENALRVAKGKSPKKLSNIEMLAEALGKEAAEEVSKAAQDATQRFTDATHAMEGTIGYDKINEKWRKFNSWMTVYQNIRLLPLVLFSSMIDPLGFMVRGGTLDDALAAYKRGVQEVLGTWTGKETRDEKTKLAEMLGVIEHQSFLDTLGHVHESMYMNSKAKKISDTFFRLNGMEAWNRAMRTQATASAVEFIKAQVQDPSEHSQRWLKELGLTTDDVLLTPSGDLIVDKLGFKARGMNEQEAAAAATRMQMAVNQWVDGAMLRPNAAMRPSWSSDPRWSLLFYMKQFTYAFHKTFLARVKNEYAHGNTAPMVAMLPFIPTMIAADVVRGLIQNGGELAPHMKGWGVGDYLMHGVQRAGLTGMYQMGLDEFTHPADILGPVVGQAVDAFSQPGAETAIEAIPGGKLAAGITK